MSIEWITRGARHETPDTTRADDAAKRLLARSNRTGAEVSVLLTDDAGIHALNRQWRNMDKPTDVLSWPLEEANGESLGDVAISLDTAMRQAQARGWDIADEIALLLIHGILHLLGYEDETEAGAESMRDVERELLGKPLEKTE
ncbi:MAG: rRNA maturation RNase YbeY [Armatimonadetes bacterium]|nr:rRNA maturation RNase YbeY [Armatimonadota bacterium]